MYTLPVASLSLYERVKKAWRGIQSFFAEKVTAKIHYRHLKYFHDLKYGEKLVDIGCGRGDFLKKFAAIAQSYYGVDIDQDYIDKTDIPRFIIADAGALCFRDSSFDIVYSSHAIEHVTDIGMMFNEFSRVLKPRGKMILIYPWEPIKGITIITNIRRFTNVHKTHKHVLNPNKIRRAISGNGLRHIGSKLYYALSPMYITCLEKK